VAVVLVEEEVVLVSVIRVDDLGSEDRGESSIGGSSNQKLVESARHCLANS